MNFTQNMKRQIKACTGILSPYIWINEWRVLCVCGAEALEFVKRDELAIQSIFLSSYGDLQSLISCMLAIDFSLMVHRHFLTTLSIHFVKVWLYLLKLFCLILSRLFRRFPVRRECSYETSMPVLMLSFLLTSSNRLLF